jgi:hypothetical protein
MMGLFVLHEVSCTPDRTRHHVMECQGGVFSFTVDFKSLFEYFTMTI